MFCFGSNFTLVKPANKNQYNEVGEGAFSNCLNLETVDFLFFFLTTISKGLFSQDSALKQIKLPSTLTTIQDNAFFDCKALEKINSDTFVVHIEKAFSDVPGAYAIVNQQFLEHEAEDCLYVNREDDAGEEGLRQAKVSYHPVFMIEKGMAFRNIR